MSTNVSLKFYLNKNKVSSGKHPVYLRIIVSRKKAEIATDYYLEEKDWDLKKSEAKKNQIINASLTKMKNEVHEVVYIIEKEKKNLTASLIKFYLNDKTTLDPPLLNFFDRYNANLEKAKELIASSITRYKDTRNHIEKFLEDRKQKELPISKIDFKFIMDFDMHLLMQETTRTGNTLQRNTVNKHHARLKTVLIRAMKENLLAKNPYIDFKIKHTPSNRTFLTQEELDKISKYSFSHNKTLDKVKDIFLFSVYTGLRFVDAQNLRTDQVVQDKAGDYCIDTVQDKTQQPILIPVLKPAVDILNKYNNEERQITGKVLPKISNQKLNVYLKEIANIVEIRKPLSHHIARHTCATTVLLSNETPIEVVSKWLGHTNIRTTQIYAKITKAHLNKIARSVDQKIYSFPKSQ
jgi:integrase/recombinase XerD